MGEKVVFPYILDSPSGPKPPATLVLPEVLGRIGTDLLHGTSFFEGLQRESHPHSYEPISLKGAISDFTLHRGLPEPGKVGEGQYDAAHALLIRWVKSDNEDDELCISLMSEAFEYLNYSTSEVQIPEKPYSGQLNRYEASKTYHPWLAAEVEKFVQK